MKVRLGSWALVAVATACSSPTPSTSSSSHWVACVQLDDCSSHPEAVACTDGYCVDSHGDRVSSETASPGNGGESGSGATPSTGGAFVRGTGGTTAGGPTASGGAIASGGSAP